MATVDQIAALRLLIAEPDDAEPYTDAALSARYDADNDINNTAYKIWIEKAAAAADLVDTTEGGSSRKMGDITEQAMALARHFQGQVAPPTVTEPGRYTRVSRLRRP